MKKFYNFLILIFLLSICLCCTGCWLKDLYENLQEKFRKREISLFTVSPNIYLCNGVNASTSQYKIIHNKSVELKKYLDSRMDSLYLKIANDPNIRLSRWHYVESISEDKFYEMFNLNQYNACNSAIKEEILSNGDLFKPDCLLCFRIIIYDEDQTNPSLILHFYDTIEKRLHANSPPLEINLNDKYDIDNKLEIALKFIFSELMKKNQK